MSDPGGAGDFIRHQDAIRGLIKVAKAKRSGGRSFSELRLIRQRVAQHQVDATNFRSLALHSLTHQLQHGKDGPECSFCYVFRKEFGQRLWGWRC